MPLIPRPTIGVGIGHRSPRNLILTGLVSLIVLLGVAAVFMRIMRQVLASGSPLAPGALMIGLGFAVAVFYGITRDSSIGLVVWVMALVFGRLVGGTGLLAVDRVAFLALAGTFFIEIVSGRRELGRLGVTEFLMLCYVIYLVGTTVVPHALPAVGEKGEARSLLDLMLTSAVLPFAGFFLARQILHSPRDLRRFLWTLTIFGTYLALTNVFWLLGPKALVFPHDIFDESVGSNPDRGRGVFLNPAVTGFALLAGFIATMHLASVRSRWRPLLVVLGLLMLVGVGLTQTRSVWLAAVAVVVFSAITYSGFRRWYIVILFVVGLLVAANWQTFTSKDRTAGGVGSVNEAQDRLNAAATGLWAIQQKPFFGWGLGRFPAINSVHHRAWGDTPWKRGYGIYPHDTQIAIGTESGLMGLTLWLLIVVSMLVASRRAWRALPRSGLVSRNLVLAFWCTTISWFVIASLIDMRLFAFPTAILFMFGGICAGIADRLAAEAAAGADEPPLLASVSEGVRA